MDQNLGQYWMGRRMLRGIHVKDIFTAVRIHCKVDADPVSLRLTGREGSHSRRPAVKVGPRVQRTEPNTPCSVLVLAGRRLRLDFSHPPHPFYKRKT